MIQTDTPMVTNSRAISTTYVAHESPPVAASLSALAVRGHTHLPLRTHPVIATEPGTARNEASAQLPKIATGGSQVNANGSARDS